MFSSLVFLFFHFETIFRVVTPDKKLLWALHQWKNPDLGPSSNIQLLDEKGMAEKGELQR